LKDLSKFFSKLIKKCLSITKEQQNFTMSFAKAPTKYRQFND